MSSKEFIKYVEEILEPFAPIKIRPMFGGYGVYKSDLIFAIIVDSELYFKADATAAEYFKSQGSRPFTYSGKNKTVSMPYFIVLPEVLEDEEMLQSWFDMAYRSALQSKKSKRK